MGQSVQKWLERNRPPRVKITYDVETGGAIEKRELPFVVGLFADLTGDRSESAPIADYAARTMQSIDRDSFSDVMEHSLPSVDLKEVKRTLPKNESTDPDKLSGVITFKSLDDFSPLAVVKAVPELRTMYRQRVNLRMIQAKLESSADLAKIGARLLALGADGKNARAPYYVLTTPRKGDSTAALNQLTVFSVQFASGADEATKADLAKAYGIVGDSAASDARKFIGLFAATDTIQNRRVAYDKLTALKAAPPPNDDAKTLQENANRLLEIIDKPVEEPGAARQQYEDAWRAALVWVGQQCIDSIDPTMTTDAISGVVLGGTQRQVHQHVANSRWFSINMLMALKGSESSDTVCADIQAVLACLDGTGPQDDDQRQKFIAPLGTFAATVLSDLDAPGESARKPLNATLAIDLTISNIDSSLSDQVREILHAKNFQALEATWRGLHYLVSHAETGKLLKLNVFNATKAELFDDMDKAVDKDQSKLFKMIYEACYGTLGGEPYSILVGGYEIGRSAQEIEFLTKISEIAAGAHAPFIAAASPEIFGMNRYDELAKPRDLEKIFESVDLVGFQEFRESEDSRYVTLVLPHVLMRLPYGAKSMPVDGFAFEEHSNAAVHEDFLWGNAAYFLAERITNAFSVYSWTAAIRGVEGGGLVEGLPLYTYPIYPTNADVQALFCPTEVSITDRREKELTDLGFIALCNTKGAGTAVFFGGQTLNQPKAYINDDATANAKLSALLPYMLAASRFAHYIKVIMRDKIGSFLTRANVESFLNSWIIQYVLLDESAPQSSKAAYPLSQAKVVVTDVPGSPGSYNAVVFLRPHFQLEELTTSIRLVANLPG